MAPKPVRWSYAARADLLEALEHIADESPQAARSLLEEVEATAASLGAFPERGTRVRGIARLIHGARDFRRAWLRRPR
jgi:plasmid stabilization system protein ParE